MLRAMIRHVGPSRLSFLALGAYSGIAVAACATTQGVPSAASDFEPNSSSSSVSAPATNGDDASAPATIGNGSGGSVGNLSLDSGATESGEACQHAAVTFLPKVPVVYVLADRSGSEFESATTGAWFTLRTATLAVIQNLQAQVAFGFGAYTGTNPSNGNMCPILDEVPIALNNYDAINTLYSMLGQPMFKAETPATLSLQKVSQEVLQATVDPSAGQVGARYILFVTDSETDFCDDGAAICPADSVTAAIQSIYSQGVNTLILGLPSDPSNPSPIAAEALQAFANAGAGLPPIAPPLNPGQAPATPVEIYQQCNGRAGWAAQYTGATGNDGTSLATYAGTSASTADASAADASIADASMADGATTGVATTSATVFSPTSTSDATALTDTIAAALQTVKSCSFDLQGQVMIDSTLGAEGTVTVDGTVVPFDASNGWTLVGSATVELVGSACDSWRAKGMTINFDFPCGAIIPVVR